jgi:hypothetical protein
MGHLGSSYCPQLLLLSSLTDTFAFHLCSIASCLGLSCLRLLSPNIWRPPYSKPEDNPDDATKTNQPMAPPRRRLTPTLRPKPTPFSPTTPLRPSPSSPRPQNTPPSTASRDPTTACQHVHHRSRHQPERRRC